MMGRLLGPGAHLSPLPLQPAKIIFGKKPVYDSIKYYPDFSQGFCVADPNGNNSDPSQRL